MSHDYSSLIKTVKDLELLGIGRNQIARKQQRGDLIKVCPGTYIAADDDRQLTEEGRAKVLHIATARRHPGAVISHSSAALLWGAPLMKLPHKVHLSISTTNKRSHAAAIFHQRRPDVFEGAVYRHGVNLTSALRTTIDCMKTLPLFEALAITDYFLRKEHLLPHQVLDACASITGRGSPSARIIPWVMSPRSESPLESLACLRIYEWGLEKPAQQLWITTPSGRRYRPDFVWQHLKLILEVDGDFKYFGQFAAPAEQVRNDMFRQRELERAGWRIIRASWKDLVHSPDLTRRELLSCGVQHVGSHGGHPQFVSKPRNKVRGFGTKRGVSPGASGRTAGLTSMG